MNKNHSTVQIGLAIDTFLLDCQARRLRPTTVRFYRKSLRSFTQFLTTQEIQTIQEISPVSLRAYMVTRESNGIKPSTIHADLRVIRAWCNFLVNEGLLDTSPMSRTKMPKVDIETLPALTEAELKTLLDAATEHRDRAILLCLLDSGCRASEFLAWNWGDVNLTTGVVRARLTKNRKERPVYLGRQALKALTVLYAVQGGNPDDPIWTSLYTGKRLHYEGLREMFRRLSKETGIHVHAHKLRRTFAVMALRAGMDIFSLQRILGHSSLAVLRRYLDLVESDLKNAFDQFGGVDRIYKKSDRF